MFLEGKVAIVTAGGGPEIGSSIVRAFAREGAAVTVADIDGERAEVVAREINDGGGKALAIALDVASEADVDRMVEQTVSAFGGVDILINHAGIGRADLIENMTAEQWRRILAVNLDGTFFCTRAVIPHMRKGGWGRIVSTSSRAAYRASPLAYANGLSAYGATKAGVVGFSRAAAFELGKYGITVNVIAPGLVSLKEVGPEELVRLRDENQVLPHRYVHPDEITAGVLYLVGPGSDRTTGQVLHINSGSYFNA